MTGEERRSETGEDPGTKRHHVRIAALVAGAALLVSAIFANDWLERAWLAKKWLYRSPHGLQELGVCAAIACASLVLLVATWRAGNWRSTSWAPLRWLLPSVAVAWVLTWRIEPPTLPFDAQLAFCAALAAWTALVAISAPWAGVGRRGILRVLDIALCEAAAVLFLAEIGLRTVRLATDTSWLATASTDPVAFVRAHRLAPGAHFMGFRVNREGFVDVEPDEVLKKSHRVVCIGDSFSVAVVPHHLQYTTIAEQCFTDLEVYNAGVVNSGPREYVEILRTSGLPLHPDLVVIALFLGNDITDAQRGSLGLGSSLTNRDEVLVVQTLRRLAAYRSEREAGGTIADPMGSTMTTGLTRGGVLTPAEADREMPWLQDPMRETPSVSAERFLWVEATRTGILRPGAKPSYEPAFGYLRQMQELARPTPIACLLFPDEYQVEDALWRDLQGQLDETGLDREQPQKIVSAWLESQGIPYVDLLPRLCAVPPLADGKQHVYHLQDTHFNARGNKVVGEALAELIERMGVAKRNPDR